MKYFAYGANMYTPHLMMHAPQVLFLGIAKLKGYHLYFHKLGNADESGKCNIVQTRDPNHVVYGVLYDVPARHRCVLDKAEKLGYGNQDITLKVYPVQKSGLSGYVESGEGIYAFTYVAHKERVREHLVPFTWYKELVIAGAREHGLPESYINELKHYEAVQDPDPQREAQHIQQLVSDVLP